MQRIGLLHPPIVHEETPGAFLIISGNFRVEILKQNSPHEASILCHVLPLETSPQKILYYILEEQLQSGPFSPMEKACFFSLCAPYMDTKSIAQSFLPMLNEKVQQHTISKHLELIKLDTKIQCSIHNGSINEKLAGELLCLKSGDRTLLHNIFLNLALGSGKQKRFLSLCRDLARREGTTIHTLLSKAEYQDILHHTEMNPPQKGALLLNTLQKQTFPESMAAEREFQQKIKAMELPANCTASHSPAFETDQTLLTVRFSSLSRMEKQLLEIQDYLKP